VWGSRQKNERKFWILRASRSEPRRAKVGVTTRSAREMLSGATARTAHSQAFRSKWVRAKVSISPPGFHVGTFKPKNTNGIKLGKYKHYKGNLYEVIGVAHHSETLEELVVYRALYDSPEYGSNALWVRPKEMFSEKVNIDGKEIPRFEFVD
jgi:hypothetical protein